MEGALFRGVSVSKYQGEIDWAAAAADDVSFAMIRMGYLDSLDPTFDANRGRRRHPESRQECISTPRPWMWTGQ